MLGTIWVKVNFPHMGLGPTSALNSVEVFLRYRSPYFEENHENLTMARSKSAIRG